MPSSDCLSDFWETVLPSNYFFAQDEVQKRHWKIHILVEAIQTNVKPVRNFPGNHNHIIDFVLQGLLVYHSMSM